MKISIIKVRVIAIWLGVFVMMIFVVVRQHQFNLCYAAELQDKQYYDVCDEYIPTAFNFEIPFRWTIQTPAMRIKPTEISMSNPNHPPHPNQGVMKDLSDDPRVKPEAQFVKSTSDERVANNVMRHEYRKLSEPEKIRMQQIKDKGLELWNLLDSIGQSRELSLAKTASEEAVMWGVKHITK